MNREPRPDATLRLYLVRHGRTRYNDAQQVQGWSDSPLTEAGWAGVAATAEHLSAVPLIAAYSSPSARTVATARSILAQHPTVPLTTLDGLRELHFGELETRPEAELHRLITDPRQMLAGMVDGTFPGLPGGESGATFRDRVTAAFAEIEQSHRTAGGDILIVSHGVTLVTYLALIGAPPERALSNASVTTVEIGPGGTPRIVSVGVDPSSSAVRERPVASHQAT